ncbi:MAG TPA: HD domain-containing protein [Candidatus Limnocylindrales bacterium]|nr:HD domain-containing protein [Candidatus Limnocylindrales bacterium]
MRRDYDASPDNHAPKPKRIYDPIHRFIELDAGEVALLALPAVQRLRRLRQLGLAYLAFPSAEHSRFSHALGALASGTRVFDALRVHSPEAFASEREFTEKRKLLRAALLLHDVGHGPFSHASEAVLGVHHEQRTEAILALPEIREALAAIDVEHAEVLGLITGAHDADPVLRELVSGPNLDADRMDYLLRDAYFTGVAGGAYDAEQLIASLRVLEIDGRPQLGVDGRGVVALESFVLARYMMFATVYFHHTTRAFERVLHDVLERLWADPRALDDVREFLGWDDFRIIDDLRPMEGEGVRALRERRTVYGLVAEFNAAKDLTVFELCERALRARWRDAVWADSQEQLLHRLPLGTAGSAPTVRVRLMGRIVDAREASDVIGKLSGKAYWRKLFVRTDAAPVGEARAVCAELIESGGQPRLL